MVDTKFDGFFEQRDHDSQIIKNRIDFKKEYAPKIKTFLINYQESFGFEDLVIDMVSVLKKGRTSSEKIRVGRSKGKEIELDPLEDGWRERLIQKKVPNVDEILKNLHEVSLNVVNNSTIFPEALPRLEKTS